MKNTISSIIGKGVTTSSLSRRFPWRLAILLFPLAFAFPEKAEAQAPSNLSYSPDSVWYSDVLFPKWQPVVTGAVSNWAVAPALPSGLNFNDSTGVITGAPSGQFGWTKYTVTATNASGSASTNIYIRSASPSSIAPWSSGHGGVWREFSYEISPADAARTKFVTMRISDLNGRLYRQVTIHPSVDGKLSVAWGPSGSIGLPPGFYFIEIDWVRDVGNEKIVRRVLLK